MLPIFSVTEFIGQVNEIIAGEFIVEGEVSQYKISQGKWIFFDLKDDQSVINCFASVFSLRTPLEDGMKVRVLGYPSIYAKSGRFSFTVQRVEMVGEGSLKRAYELLKATLAQEGLFDAARKRSIPKIPERIGVIASRDSAAFGDFKRILGNRWAGVEVVLRHVQVQGETAVADIVEAFHEFNEYDGPFDVLVLIRGGGSLEDLAAFNNESVVRAIYGSKVPVVSGVGHERDETLADLVADVRASTPSNAAELVVPDRDAILRELAFTLDTISSAFEHQLALNKQRIDRQVTAMLGKLELPLERCAHSISLFKTSAVHLEKRLGDYQNTLAAADLLFKNVNPRRVLERGYSIVRNTKGAIVSSSESVDTGETLVVEFAKGEVVTQVVSK